MSGRSADAWRAYLSRCFHDTRMALVPEAFEAGWQAGVQAERRRIIALAREYGTESTTALADQLAQEDAG